MQFSPRVALLLFGSGACALVYQVVWFRHLRLIFGASTSASAAVLAVFALGLGLGGALLGKRVANKKRPLLFYAYLEMGVAVSAMVTPVLVWVAQRVYVLLGGTATLGSAGTVVRLLLSVVILGLPTFLMGGTMPAAAQAVESDGDSARRRWAVLYGTNTLGAVFGVWISNFALLEVLGTQRLLVVAGLANLLLAVVARKVALAMPEQSASTTPVGKEERVAPAIFVFAAAFLTGWAFYLMELVWYRILAPILGGSLFTFGLILAVALFGIGLGGVGYSLRREGARASLLGFAASCALEALCLALPLALGDRVALLAQQLRALDVFGFAGLVLTWLVIAGLVVFPASLVAGYQFPMLISLLGKGGHDVGRHIGQSYLANTLGSILGAIMGGFIVLPRLGAIGTWRAVVASLAALALVAFALGARRFATEMRRGGVTIVALALALLWMRAPGPTAFWRESQIGVGRLNIDSLKSNALIDRMNQTRRGIIAEWDGVESTVAIHGQSGLAFMINGKSDGHVREDAPTQVMSGLVGALVYPGEVKRVLVIGLGTGSTAGWLAKLPNIEAVDVVELEPTIVEMAKRSALVTEDALNNPKIRLIIGDARETLMVGRAQYDLIFSEPSNPYRAGIASLFTLEFYRAVLQRLRPGGLFLQWVQTYEIDAQTMRTIFATLSAVFGSVETWSTMETDLLLVSSAQPLVYDLDMLAKRADSEPWRRAMLRTWRSAGLAAVLSHFVAGRGLAAAVAKAEEELNTDDQTLIEFGFARGFGKTGGGVRPNDLRRVAHLRNEDFPENKSGKLNREAVALQRMLDGAAEEIDLKGLARDLPPVQVQRAQALSAWLTGQLAVASAKWPSGLEPQVGVETEMLAELSAEAHAADAVELAERVRGLSPAQAEACLARYALRGGDVAGAAEHTAKSLEAFREDPWPNVSVMRRLFGLVRELCNRDPQLSARLFTALERPFAVNLLEEDRQNLRVDLSAGKEFAQRCQPALAALEPYVPWNLQFLGLRVRCYEVTGNALLENARRDLDQFIANQPAPFGTGLVPERKKD